MIKFTFAYMRLSVTFVLFSFVFFLSFPTFLVLVEKDISISLVYSNAEEEESNNLKSEVKILIKNSKINFLTFLGSTSGTILCQYAENYNFISVTEVLIPPPERS